MSGLFWVAAPKGDDVWDAAPRGMMSCKTQCVSVSIYEYVLTDIQTDPPKSQCFYITSSPFDAFALLTKRLPLINGSEGKGTNDHLLPLGDWLDTLVSFHLFKRVHLSISP